MKLARLFLTIFYLLFQANLAHVRHNHALLPGKCVSAAGQLCGCESIPGGHKDCTACRLLDQMKIKTLDVFTLKLDYFSIGLVLSLSTARPYRMPYVSSPRAPPTPL